MTEKNWWQAKQVWLIAGLIILAAGYLVIRGLHRVQTWTLESQSHVVVQAPFGDRPGDLAVAQGIDGRQYGPLGFVAEGRSFWIADTYHHRLVEVTPGRPWKITDLGERLPEDLTATPQGLYFVDNQTLAVYRVSDQHVVKIIQMTQEPGYSQAIWHMEAYQGGLLIEGVKIGRGLTETWLAKYTDGGQFVRTLNESEGSGSIPFHVDAAYDISTVVRSFQVSPSGRLYVEAAGNDRYQREVLVYSGEGRLVRRVAVLSPESIVHSELLSINRLGWVYMGINLNVPDHALILVVRPDGLSTALHVSAVAVRSVVYGSGGPNGSVNLLQSTPSEYRIARWDLIPATVWQWRRPFS